MDFYPSEGFGFSRETSPARKDTLEQTGGKFGFANGVKPDRLHISTSTRQVFGQYTPPTSLNSPSRDAPFFDDMTMQGQEPESENEQDDTYDPEAEQDSPTGPTTRKRRSTRQSQPAEMPVQTPTTPRRRRKGGRKVDSNEKRSQFLERNRVAASKCRQKKKEWTNNLESRARELQATKNSMVLLVASLREELLYLKGEALKHTTCDCSAVRNYLARQAESPFNYDNLGGSQSPFLPPSLSAGAMDLNQSMMHGSPSDDQSDELPELGMMGSIPD